MGWVVRGRVRQGMRWGGGRKFHIMQGGGEKFKGERRRRKGEEKRE